MERGQALVDEPQLTEGGMMDDAMRGFMRAAMQSLAPPSSANA